MEPAFAPPGPGQWALDRSHYPGCATPISQWLLVEGMRDGFGRVFKELGLPAETIDLKFVHGFMYSRLRPLVGADSEPRKPPPAVILKLVTRVHPGFRARNRQAEISLRDRPSNDVVQRWEDELRPRLLQANTDFQNFDVNAANDVQLQSHVTTLLDQLRSNFELHFWLHGHDLGPVARYLHTSIRWGLDPVTAISALAGASPSTSKPAESLVKLREMLEAADPPVADLDEFRASSDEARTHLDTYLRERGHVLVTGYDLDSRTLIELPSVVFNSIRSAKPPPDHNAEGISGELRNQLAPSHRNEFDVRLSDARAVMDMRDDNGPLTIEWPVGLLRRALLEAGRRLVDRSTMNQIEHVFELSPAESRELFGGGLPSVGILGERAEKRAAQSKVDAPELLGPDEPEPPLKALPPALRELTQMVNVAMKYIGMDGAVGAERFAGAGIGTVRYVGVARVAMSADEAFDRLNPGEVLIVRATSPAFNAVLAIAGAVVTADGGVLSHAAVLSRELGIPAVIGVPGALSIEDGSTVEVDPTVGRIRVIAPAP